ncbi:MAG: hypothetical protein AAGI30_06750 [Planctomycetota bacterium]
MVHTRTSPNAALALLIAAGLTTGLTSHAAAEVDLVDGLMTVDLDSSGIDEVAAYGNPLVFQQVSPIQGTNTLPVDIVASIDNSNVAGVGGVEFDNTPTFPDGGADLVQTGLEIAVPLAELGHVPGDPIKVTAIILSGGFGFMSNQVVGFNPTSNANIGTPATTNFTDDLNFPGNQFVVVNPTPVSGATAVDGTITAPDEGANYSAALWEQQGPTGFGNSNNPARGVSSGSELNAIYAFVSDNGTAGDTTDDVLHVLLTGNLESNFNQLAVFFDVDELLQPNGPGGVDVDTVGQQQLLNFNPDIDFNNFNNNLTGLTFDFEFGADYAITINNGNVDTQSTEFDDDPMNGDERLDDTAEYGVSTAVLVTTPVEGSAAPGGFQDGIGGGFPSFISGPTGTLGVAPFSGEGVRLTDLGTADGADDTDNLIIDFDQSNIAGTTDANPTVTLGANVGDPALVDTGLEFQVDLNDTDWDGASDVAVVGLIVNSDGTLASNQVIGVIPGSPTNLEAPNTINFNDADTSDPERAPITGNQSISSTTTALPAATVDGVRDAFYPASPLLYVNPGLAAGFGDNLDASVEDSTGSEIDNATAYISDDGQLNIHIGGNLHGGNRIVLGIDVDGNANGQNLLRGDNFGAGGGVVTNIGDQSGEGDGLQWEDGVFVDLIVTATSVPNNNGTADLADDFTDFFVDAASTPTDPELPETPSIGGFVGGGNVADSLPVTGQPTSEFGSGDNDDPSELQANGDSLDAVYVQRTTVDGEDSLVFFFAGNLSDGFNKLNLFIDNGDANGQNVIIPEGSADENPIIDGDLNPLARMGGVITETDPVVVIDPAGLSFDNVIDATDPASDNFNATHFISLAHGNFGFLSDSLGNETMEEGTQMFGSFATLVNVASTLPDAERARFVGQVPTGTQGPGADPFNPIQTNGVPTNADPLGIAERFRFNINNSNIAGVAGGPTPFEADDPNDGLTLEEATNAVMSGIELVVPLEDIGYDPDALVEGEPAELKFFAHISDGVYAFVTSQALPSTCDPEGELGEVREINHNDLEGDQFITISLPADGEMVPPGNGDFVVRNAATLPGPCEMGVVGPNNCPGDTDNDNDADADDFIRVLVGFGTTEGATQLDGDFDGDGDVDADDFITMLVAFGATYDGTPDCNTL